MLDIPLGQALKRSAQNKQSKWPDRFAENRLNQSVGLSSIRNSN